MRRLTYHVARAARLRGGRGHPIRAAPTLPVWRSAFSQPLSREVFVRCASSGEENRSWHGVIHGGQPEPTKLTIDALSPQEVGLGSENKACTRRIAPSKPDGEPVKGLESRAPTSPTDGHKTEQERAADVINRMQNVLSSRKGEKKISKVLFTKPKIRKSGRRRKGKHKTKHRRQNHNDIPAGDLTPREVKHFKLRNKYFSNLSIDRVPQEFVTMSRSEYVYMLFSQALDSVQSREEESLESFDLHMLSRTLDEFVKLDMWKEALEVISTFETQIITVSEEVGTVPSVFLNLNKEGQVDVSRRIAKLYQTAMIALGDAGEPHMVMDLYRRMSHYLQRTVSPDTSSLNDILRDTFSYSSMLRGCARSQFGARRGEAEWWFQEMLRVGVQPSLVSARFMLLACEKDVPAGGGKNFSNYDEAERWFSLGRKIVQRGVEETQRTKRSRRQKHHGGQQRFLRQQEHRVAEWGQKVRNFYNTMIRCCARAPGGARQERSEELFAELCALGPGGEWLADKDQRGHHDVELHQGAKDGSMKKKNADTEKFLPNANTFAGMILSCARREGGSDLARARELYDQHIKLAAHARGHLHHKGPEFVSEFQTTADILTGMIECCQKSTKMKQKMLRESLDFFRKLRDNRGRGLKPTVKVYNHLLWCCAREPVRANDLARAEQLFKELTAGGEEKLTHANGFPLIDHVSQGSGRGYLSDEVDWTLRPNVDTYNALLMACANVTSEQGGAHKRKAEMYYGMMKTEGGAVVPNEVTFEAMLRAEQRSPWPSKEKIEAWRNELSWYSRGYKDVLGEVEENPRLFEEEFGVSAAGFGSEILEDENDIVHTTRGSDWCDD